MQQKCVVDGVAVAQVEQCWNKVAGDGTPVSSYESYLPDIPPTIVLAYNATTLGGTMLVNDSYYLDTKETLLAYAGQEKDHALYR
jgi:hypothetical protein